LFQLLALEFTMAVVVAVVDQEQVEQVVVVPEALEILQPTVQVV
jgi:hypothetical protein